MSDAQAGAPQVYDINLDAMRPVTQAEVDTWQRMEQAFGALRMFLGNSPAAADSVAVQIALDIVHGDVTVPLGMARIRALRPSAGSGGPAAFAVDDKHAYFSRRYVDLRARAASVPSGLSESDLRQMQKLRDWLDAAQAGMVQGA